MAILLFLLFMAVVIYGLSDPNPPATLPRGSTPWQDAGLKDEEGRLTVKGMAFLDGLDGKFDGGPPDIHQDWW